MSFLFALLCKYEYIKKIDAHGDVVSSRCVANVHVPTLVKTMRFYGQNIPMLKVCNATGLMLEFLDLGFRHI